jgi:hypothetical protein
MAWSRVQTLPRQLLQLLMWILTIGYANGITESFFTQWLDDGGPEVEVGSNARGYDGE